MLPRRRFRPGNEVPDMVDDRRIRVVVAKPGHDGHDRGAKVIAIRDWFQSQAERV